MLSRRRNHIRAKVESLLSESGISGPAVPVEKIAARHGIEVRCQPIDEEGVSGFLARQPGRPAIIGVNSNQPDKRRRFTIAHELGHFFLHGEQGQQEVHIDRTQQFSFKLRSPASSRGDDLEEVEANLFAAELLMPTRFIERDVRRHAFDLSDDDGTVASMANTYGVSTQAMSIRLAYLGLINQET
jgi:Zn-dependent peptidase ImmA (M78 family)